MNLIHQHIHKHLPYFEDEEDSFFHEIMVLIESKAKNKHASLLRYIHLLLNEVFSGEKSETKMLHLHFVYNFNNNALSVISQYLLIRFFMESSKTAVVSSQGNEKTKTNLRSELKKLSTCPDGASGRNGGNKVYKDWIRRKKELKTLISFYDKLGKNIEIFPKTIFNCQVRLADSLEKLFLISPYAHEIKKKYRPTFNLLNTKLTLNQIDEVNNAFIDDLENVILFDCERKKLMQYFSLQDLKDYGVNLKKYLILSFGNRNNSVQSLRNKLTLIQSRFKIPDNISYSILQSEVDFSLKRKGVKYIPASFIGMYNSNIWDAFVLETSILDLYELRSVKMMNLYSLCFNEEYKNFILQDLFSEKDTSNLISDETKLKLLDLRDEDFLVLKKLLGNVLDLIISSEIKQDIREKIKRETLLIVDDFVLNSKHLRNLISSSLLLTHNNKLVSWSTLKSVENYTILILSYQDQGKYPHYFYPNIIEATTSKNVMIDAIYHKFFFFNRYQWAKYNIANDLHKLLDHPVRQGYFNWRRLKDSIESLKPQKRDDINWDLEQQYSENGSRETIKLKLKNERERTFNSSELFIYSNDNKQSFRVEKIGDIIDVVDEDVKYFVHHLDEIQEDINLYEKMIDTSQHEEELNIIRQQFQLSGTETGRLWKVLLKQKALNTNSEDLYDELKKYLENKGLKIVSLNHFKNNWLNPDSESIAPLYKKVFVEICNFLKLPKIYFILIQRLRNVSKQSSRQSTRLMNKLLQDLFNDGCFDDGMDLSEKITSNLQSYKRRHPLDELGIDEKYLGENLIALVELIKAEVTLKEMQKFKKVE